MVTGEGEGVSGVMLQSFLAVAGEDGTDKRPPAKYLENERITISTSTWNSINTEKGYPQF